MVHHKTVPTLTVAALLACTLSTKPVAFNRALLALAQTTSPSASFPVLETIPQGTQVRISSGSDSMETLSKALQQGFGTTYATGKVSIETKTTDQAIQDVLSDNADFAAISRPLTAAEKEKGLEAMAIKREKIAIVIDKSNPFAQSLTGNQFAQVFRGEIVDWSALGGTPGPIKLVDRPATSEIRQALRPYPVFASAPFEAAAGATILQSETTDALVEALGPDGIGYVLVSQLADQPGLKALQLHNTPPTDPRYPFSQPYSLVYAKGATSSAVAAFLGYATGQPGQAVVARTRLSGTGDSPVAASPATTAATTAATASDAASDDQVSSEIEPNAIDSDVGAENEYVQEDAGRAVGDIDNPDAERERWWWLLLPLAGLGLLIWAASKSSSEEETGYPASSTPETVQGDRIISAFDSEPSSGEVDSDVATEPAAGVAAPTDVTIGTATAATTAATTTTAVGEPFGPIDTGTGAIGGSTDGADGIAPHDTDIPPDPVGAPSSTFGEGAGGLRSEVRKAPGSAGSEDWVQRAKQRINEATEQMKQTAAETKDETTKRG